MNMIKDEDKLEIKKVFSALENDVKMIFFTQEHECQYCSHTHELLNELAPLSDKLHLEVYDFVRDADKVKKYGIDKIPAIVLEGERDYGIRFYGIPAGYEFTTLIEDILDVSRRNPGLDPKVLAELSKVDKPVHMQAMVSPTCPYCPGAVRTAHKFAMACEFITGDMVEISEFPQLAVKYNVKGVPNTIINESFGVIGAMPEMNFVKEILKAIGK